MNTTQKDKLAVQIVEASKRGDRPALRESLAQFALANEGLIRHLARQKLNSDTRRTQDSEDVMSSVLRRIDLLASEGRFRVQDEAGLRALLLVVTRNTAVTKYRLVARAKQFLEIDGPYMRALHDRVNQCEGDDEAAVLVSRMLLSLENADQRQFFELRLRGATHQAAAEVMGISAEAARWRWTVIVKNLRALFTEMENHDGE